MTVGGADRGSATAAPTALTFSHATWDTVKTVAVGGSGRQSLRDGLPII